MATRGKVKNVILLFLGQDSMSVICEHQSHQLSLNKVCELEIGPGIPGSIKKTVLRWKWINVEDHPESEQVAINNTMTLLSVQRMEDSDKCKGSVNYFLKMLLQKITFNMKVQIMSLHLEFIWTPR